MHLRQFHPAVRLAMSGLLIAMALSTACTAHSPGEGETAPERMHTAGDIAPAPVLDASRSASLAGVAEDLDAEPADLEAASTYALPGLLRRQDNIDDLRRRFGAANVRAAEIAGAEGEMASGIVLFPDDPSRRAELFLQDEAAQRGIWSVRVSGNRSRWHLDNGVSLGMTLNALVKLNGKPVRFNGLDWDYGGVVSDWNSGRLMQRPEDIVFRAVSLRHADDAPEGSYPLGDGEYPSDAARYPAQGTVLHVGELLVTFQDPQA